MGSNTAFVLLVIGVLGIDWELMRPGRMFPGAIGLGLCCSGGYLLLHNSPTMTGMLLILGASLLLVVESLWRVPFISGVLGTVCLIAGFLMLFQRSHRIVPVLAVAASILIGSAAVFLAAGARKARENKRSDL